MAGKVTANMSLKQFMMRKQVLDLYRNILRTIREVPGDSNKKELKDWVRADFRSNIHVNDENAVKALLQHGNSFLEELRRSLSMTR
ncbi:LYR motif-containing protein 2 [Ischnura elegans]|uniref:LYR motif-containing protein 2 n=1 Tax=Ischnura elegans TaxID=197161 RepID=UPI001ED86D0F|nr:LYR motif-containing protein 2 [Ischnura elegans]